MEIFAAPTVVTGFLAREDRFTSGRRVKARALEARRMGVRRV